MRHRGTVVTVALLSTIFTTNVGASAPPTEAASVNIDNFSFTPPQLTVEHGTQVHWTNRDDIPHTITEDANPRVFKSPPLDTGDGFSYVFQTPGTYHYFCSLHPHMVGTIVVK